MNIHEYQAKEILQKYGILVPPFVVVETLEQAKEALDKLGWKQGVVKAQVHAGGRGKAGAVKFAKSYAELLDAVKQILGMKIVNNQTGAEGLIAHKVLISEPVEIVKEYYIGAIIDRATAQALLIASPAGGMDIEEVAKTQPQKILSLPIRPDGSLYRFQLQQLVNFMGWKNGFAEAGIKIAKGVAKAFIETDASLLEINPLVETPHDLVAVDAKLAIDENALFRQPEISQFYDATQVPKNEALAQQHELAYIALDGNIGCMVNGAGLAMATMDIIKHHGGKPANFLDVGGGASQEKVAAGFKILLSDPKVKAILVNIFGGIMSCKTLALGIVAAAKELNINVPLVVRMEGTEVEEGRAILSHSGLPIIAAQNLTEAAEKVVNAINK